MTISFPSHRKLVVTEAGDGLVVRLKRHDDDEAAARHVTWTDGNGACLRLLYSARQSGNTAVRDNNY